MGKVRQIVQRTKRDLRYWSYGTDFKSTGNSGNTGNSPEWQGLYRLKLCPLSCHLVFTGNSSNRNA